MFGLMYWVSCLFFIFRFALKLQSLLSYFHFTPKWGSCFQLKTLKMRFYCFHFLVVSCFHFYWKCFQKSNQTHFHHHFLFSVKMKTENNQTKHPIGYYVFVGRVSSNVYWLNMVICFKFECSALVFVILTLFFEIFSFDN